MVLKVVQDVICGYLECLQLWHYWKIYSSQIVAWELQDQVLEVDELAEEKTFVYESTWPL